MAAGLSERALHLPLRELPLVHAYAAGGGRTTKRIGTLSRLLLEGPALVVASAAAAMQALAPPEVLKKSIRTLRLGEELPPRELLAALQEAGYEIVPLVEGPGQAALRGDILDCYPPHAAAPCRIEFFGDEIDRIAFYDPLSQRTERQVSELLLSPASEAPQDAAAIARVLQATAASKGFDAQRIAWEEGHACPGAETLLPLLYPGLHTLFDYLPADAFLLLDEPQRIQEEAASTARLFEEEIAAMLLRGEGHPAQAGLLLAPDALLKRLKSPRTALFSALKRGFSAIRPKETLAFQARSAPQYPIEAGREELARDIAAWKRMGAAVLLYAGARASRLQEQLRDAGCEAALAPALRHAPTHGAALILEESLPYGLYDPALRFIALSERELFAGGMRPKKQPRRSGREKLTFADLRAGDLIVHEAHGIGRFLGVEALSVENHTRDYLLLQYAGGDRLYIPTDQLDRVQKYIGGGGDDSAVRLSKLGGGEWTRQVSRARGAVKALAIDLAKLYAERRQVPGFAFSPDSAWQRELEERFPFEETPDQLLCIREIKADMERPHPMDRLLCGDVGYGKTEVALRAAFKAVQDSKQVAFLVPTTILAQQHYNTLTSRFSGFPVRVALLSRFKTAQEQKKIREALAEGQIDVLIGTHAILSKETKFKDLGLLIVDEEQRFGVGHKEQIKALRASIDVLTLSATPIPRTLHMSMVGIRDMSVIETPPAERYPVETYVLAYSDALLVDALRKELGRGGQCYVVDNRVAALESFAGRLAALLPEARIAIAHGQMPERQLEQAMLEFLEGKHDILLSSTIIENGLDIPNVNTLFVLDADRMGLSQLYQLRGRVGRSTRLGYAYFTFERDKTLSEVAHKRLSALAEFTQFGAGLEIALKDLELRGAGSLLGAEQHGHIADVGYEYYCKLMDEALKEARGEKAAKRIEAVVEFPVDAHIPKEYIPHEILRLEMYRRIALIESRAGRMDVEEELIDRYGDIPAPVEHLMDAALLKAMAERAEATNLTIREGQAKLLFHPEAQLDGGRLLAAASEYGAQLLPGTEQLALLFRREKADALAIGKAFLPLLEEIGKCVES